VGVAVHCGQAAAGGCRELADRELEAQVAAARGQTGEDHVDDVGVIGTQLANEDAAAGGVHGSSFPRSGAFSPDE
jgi:hypothetical protein